MVEAEPAIRQLLKLDFEPKVNSTIRRTFRQTINQTLKTQLLPAAEVQADEILQQYTQARAYLEQTLEKEAEEKILRNQRLLSEVEQKIEAYNYAIARINSCFEAMGLYENKLAAIGQTDFISVSHESEADQDISYSNGIVGNVDA